MLNLRFVVSVVSVFLLGLGAGVVSGQDYPNKPIRIVTSPIGGGSDFVSRQIAQGISGPLGQPVIVDNRGGGIIGQEVVSKALPDGYTLLVGGGATWVFPLLQKAPYDVERDYAPISLISREINVVAVHPSVPAQSIKELIALAKAKPGELNYSTGSIGGSSHLAVELFKSMAGVNIVSVVYMGTSPSVTALISGEVQMTIYDAGLLVPLMKSGKLRALAVTSAQPTALAPGLPTVAASGLPGYEAIALTGSWAPAKTARAIINRLNLEIVRVLNRPEVKERFLGAGAETVGSSPEEFAATMKNEIAKTAKVIKEANIRTN